MVDNLISIEVWLSLWLNYTKNISITLRMRNKQRDAHKHTDLLILSIIHDDDDNNNELWL